jgi:hypothetical protein
MGKIISAHVADFYVVKLRQLAKEVDPAKESISKAINHILKEKYGEQPKEEDSNAPVVQEGV